MKTALDVIFWWSIPWYEWLYSINQYWVVRSDRYKNRFRKCLVGGCWYHQVTLCVNYIKKTFLIHRLLWEIFLTKDKSRTEINHKNWIITDNRLENLEWCTRSENMQHSYKNLWRVSHFTTKWPPTKWKSGKDSHLSKAVVQYDLKLNIINEFESLTQAWSKSWVSAQSIQRVCAWIKLQAWWFIWKYKTTWETI